MERPSYRLLLIPILLLIGSCAFFCAIGFVIPEQLARLAAPPEYPNSELIGRDYSGGTDSMWDRRIYRTSDDLTTVLAYMEKHMPGFLLAEDPSTSAPSYFNNKCDKSLLAQLAAQLISVNDLFPCASVWLYEDPNSAGTRIRMWLSWPAP